MSFGYKPLKTNEKINGRPVIPVSQINEELRLLKNLKVQPPLFLSTAGKQITIGCAPIATSGGGDFCFCTTTSEIHQPGHGTARVWTMGSTGNWVLGTESITVYAPPSVSTTNWFPNGSIIIAAYFPSYEVWCIVSGGCGGCS